MNILEQYFISYCPLASEASKDAARGLYTEMIAARDLADPSVPSIVDRYQAALNACKTSHRSGLDRLAESRFNQYAKPNR